MVDPFPKPRNSPRSSPDERDRGIPRDCFNSEYTPWALRTQANPWNLPPGFLRLIPEKGDLPTDRLQIKDVDHGAPSSMP